MDAREIHAKLQKGLEDAEQGRVKDASRAFEVFRNER
jgi:predicted transcriptional regulator